MLKSTGSVALRGLRLKGVFDVGEIAPHPELFLKKELVMEVKKRGKRNGGKSGKQTRM